MIKKIKYVIFVFICMCVTPLITHAECDYQRLAELSRLASNVQFSYTYDLSQGLTFTLYVTNLTNDIYVIDDYGNRFYGLGEKSLLYSAADVSGFQNGDRIAFNFYSNDNNCKNEAITTRYVSFPYYNAYSTLEECQLHPNFKYCQVWMDVTGVNYEKFTSELNKYLANTETIESAPEPDPMDELFAILNQPYVKIVGIILLCAVIFVLLIFIFKKIRYKRR